MAFEIPQLWQFDDEHPGHYEANPGHALQQLGLATPSWMVAQPVLAFPVQGFQFGFSRSRMGPNAMLHGGGYAVQASFVLDAHGDQLGVGAPRVYAGPAAASGRDRPGGIRYVGLPSCGRTAAKPAVMPVRAAISVVACRTGTMEQQRGFA